MPQRPQPEIRGELIRLQDRKPLRQDRRASNPLNVDLSPYQAVEEHDDYRHRMRANLAAAVVIVLLVGAGIWLAESMAAFRKNQDCAMAGRRNCIPLEVPIQPRW